MFAVACGGQQGQQGPKNDCTGAKDVSAPDAGSSAAPQFSNGGSPSTGSSSTSNGASQQSSIVQLFGGLFQ